VLVNADAGCLVGVPCAGALDYGICVWLLMLLWVATDDDVVVEAANQQ